MPAIATPVQPFGWRAAPFDLPAVDGRRYALEGIAGPKATVVMFICNHCPYVTGVVDRLVADMNDLLDAGVGVAAICANDAESYPADSFENMKRFADEHRFGFPYLHDESQAIAREYQAVCTPDFFGFDADLGLQYRGRLDAAGRGTRTPGMRRDLVEAMLGIAEGGPRPEEQPPSMGCSIKWRE